jgi:predicted outer membrane repeat protein
LSALFVQIIHASHIAARPSPAQNAVYNSTALGRSFRDIPVWGREKKDQKVRTVHRLSKAYVAGILRMWPASIGHSAERRSRRSYCTDRLRAGESLEARVLLTTFAVQNTNDSGPGSLRQAVTDANANPGEDLIQFTGAVFTNAGSDTILLTSGRITINSDLRIVGPGATRLTISSGGRSQLLLVTGASTDVTIEGVALSGGRAGGTSFNTGSGGAIFNDNSGLTLRQVVFTNNSARVDGGALYNASGTVNWIDSTLTSSSAGRGGGGLASNGQLNVAGGTLTSNVAAYGGAIAVGEQGVLEVQQSVFSGNDASVEGSAIYNFYGSMSVATSMFQNNSAETAGTVTNYGDAIVSSSTFSGNAAYYGAGFANAGGATMVVTGSTFRNGTAGREGGGGLNAGGVLTVIDSEFVDNISNGAGGGLALARGAVTSVIGSTFASNSTTYFGAGILNTQDSRLNVVNSTISGNRAQDSGAGIYNNGELTLTNSTIVNNRADSDGARGGSGGGIYTVDRPTVVSRLFNTIVAGNLRGASGSSTGNDIDGRALSNLSGFNLVGTPAFTGGLVHGANGNIVGQSGSGGTRIPLSVGTVINMNLAVNGGPTRTHALLAGSVAINAGSNALSLDGNGFALLTDQRGAGFGRILGSAVDIGAFEF